MTEKKGNETITETKTGGEKTFGGPGVEGKKTADKKAPKKPKADKGPSKKELEAELDAAKAKHKRCCEEEDKGGIMTGQIMTSRQARERAIKDIEWRIENHGKKG